MIRKAVALLAGALLLAGCGAEVNTGVAARVGGAAIETSSFAARVERAFEDPFFSSRSAKPEYQALLLTNLVRSHLFETAAQRLGARVTDEQLDAELAKRFESAGGEDAYYTTLARNEGIHRDDARDALRYELIWPAVEDALVKDVAVSEDKLRAAYEQRLATYDTARVAHILVRSRTRAAAVAKLAKAPGADFAALAKRYSVDTTTRDNGGEFRDRMANGQGRFEKEFEDAVFDAPVGRVVGPVRTVTDDAAKIEGFEIFKVIERTTVSFADARPQLRRLLLAQQIGERLATYMRALAVEEDVRVNPRFGRWDGQRLAVLPGESGGLSSPAPIPGLAPPQPGPPQNQQPTVPATTPATRPTATP